MTIQPKLDEFMAGGNVRTADVLKSAAKELRRIIGAGASGNGSTIILNGNELRRLANHLARLGELETQE